MRFDRRTFLAGGLAGTVIMPARLARAQAASTIRIGVITDMSGVYRDVSGPTTVACAQQAADEFMAQNPSIKVEIVVADHQNKPDIGLAIIRRWFDEGGVDMIENVGNSAIALGSRPILDDRKKAAVITTAGSSDITGKSCSANWVHWSWDSWCLAHSTATSLVATGGTKWFFITADYAFGHAAQADAAKFAEASGGRVVGSVKYPFGATSDFSSFLLQAQGSGANVVAFANSGSELIACLKQAQEFGLAASGIRLAAMVGYVTDVLGMGLPVAKGLSLTETFYWDLNERTRAFMGRMRPMLPAATFPNMSQAGDYAGVSHYLKAVKELGVARAKASGREVVETMKKMPTDDDGFGIGHIRQDGRKIHPAYLFEVKAPAESGSVGDVYKLVSTVPAEEAFRPMSEGRLPARAKLREGVVAESLPIIDLRSYTIALRRMPEFLDVFDRLAMPVQLRHLRPPLLVTTSAVGALNQVVHLWEFSDMGDFERRHAARDRDPGWPAYLQASAHLITAQETRLLRRASLPSLGGL